jgi:two-component system, cell cycle sensor histidine kinase and response regulator CckA
MAGYKETILAVDDEPGLRELLIAILTEEGYDARAAGSGEAALQSAEAFPPDLILLDVRMPGMDGLEVCRRLKAREQSRKIPLMFLSATAEEEKRVEGLALGAVDFVSKPFCPAELLARVRNHLELGRLRNQLEAQAATRTVEMSPVIERLRGEIAERQRTEKALRESEERFRNLANTAPVMIALAGTDQAATFFNKCWLDFTGRTMEQELGSGWEDGVHPHDREMCRARLASAYSARSECRMEYRLRRADGEYRDVLCKSVPRFEPGGFAGYIACLTDITDLKRGQPEALARQKLESLGVLASGIAHDFNSLLGGITADSEALLGELEGASPARESVERMAAAAGRAAGILRLLAACAGQESTATEEVDLAGLVRETLELIKVSISNKAQLKLNLPQGLPAVRGNPAQIRQAVMNLILNASEALPGHGGVISVGLARADADRLRLTVSDTGAGMTKEVEAGIFDPFFTTKGKGRGRGLAAVHGIVRGHGGAIRVTSAPGQGSSFEVLLPCGTAKEDAVTIARQVSPEESPVGTVLLIDDEETLRLAVAKMLRRKGFSVIETGDGRAGIEQFRTRWREVDVVLLDVMLAGISGREVLEELRRTQPKARVILTTAYGRERAVAAMGGDPSLLYLRKPYRIVEVLKLLTGMGRRAAGSSAAR